MKTLLIAIGLLLFNNAAWSQENCYSSKYIELYQQILGGQRQFGQLTAQEKICVSAIIGVISRSSPPKETDDCEYAWDAANSAAEDVVGAAKRLIRCVEGSDHQDDCYSEARRVRSYHSDYESAVSTVQYECY